MPSVNAINNMKADSNVEERRYSNVEEWRFRTTFERIE
jgi:hypothetical protein